jgi:hypothetical protein
MANSIGLSFVSASNAKRHSASKLSAGATLTTPDCSFMPGSKAFSSRASPAVHSLASDVTPRMETPSTVTDVSEKFVSSAARNANSVTSAHPGGVRRPS